MEMFENNFQSVMDPGPSYKPRAFYYALQFMSFIINDSPAIGKPGIAAGTSLNIKAWVLHTVIEPNIFKLIILNRDQNTSLNGTVRLNAIETQRLSCMYLEAESLTSTDGFYFAGYHYEGNNS